jgi:hypothetical protein
LPAIRYARELAGHPTPTDDERVRATARHPAHDCHRRGEDGAGDE